MVNRRTSVHRKELEEDSHRDECTSQCELLICSTPKYASKASMSQLGVTDPSYQDWQASGIWNAIFGALPSAGGTPSVA